MDADSYFMVLSNVLRGQDWKGSIDQFCETHMELFDFDGEESNLGYRNKDLDLTQLPSARAASRGGERDASRPTTRLPVRSTRRSKPEAL